MWPANIKMNQFGLHTHICVNSLMDAHKKIAQQKKSGGTSDIRISLSVSHHPFFSSGLKMRVVMVTGAEKSPHGPPHPPWCTHTCTHKQIRHLLLFLFLFLAVVRTLLMSLLKLWIYHIGHRCISGLFEAVWRLKGRKKNVPDRVPDGVQTSLKFKRESNITGEGKSKFNLREICHWGCSLCVPHSPL